MSLQQLFSVFSLYFYRILLRWICFHQKRGCLKCEKYCHGQRIYQSMKPVENENSIQHFWHLAIVKTFLYWKNFSVDMAPEEWITLRTVQNSWSRQNLETPWIWLLNITDSWIGQSLMDPAWVRCNMIFAVCWQIIFSLVRTLVSSHAQTLPCHRAE